MAQDGRRSASPNGPSSDGSGKAPGVADGGGEKDDRTARLEQALRANLRRRKAQSRARAETAPPAEPTDERK